jgi:hypothetical protein
LEGQIWQMVLQQCQILKHKHPVWPTILMIQTVLTLSTCETQTSTLTKWHHNAVLQKCHYLKQTSSLTKRHHGKSCIRAGTWHTITSFNLLSSWYRAHKWRYGH